MLILFLGFVGDCLWTEALNDVIVETLHEFTNNLISKYTFWKILKKIPEPENSEKLVEDLRNDLLKRLDYIKSITEKNGKKLLLCDKVRIVIKTSFYLQFSYCNVEYVDRNE